MRPVRDEYRTCDHRRPKTKRLRDWVELMGALFHFPMPH